jgi:hypothetical protein
MKTLKLRAKKEWIEKIATGRKKIEYRAYSDFYVIKLAILPAVNKIFKPKPFTEIYLYCGNEKNSLFVKAEIKGIFLDNYDYFIRNNIKPPEGMTAKNMVFSIELGKIIETNVKITK